MPISERFPAFSRLPDRSVLLHDSGSDVGSQRRPTIHYPPSDQEVHSMRRFVTFVLTLAVAGSAAVLAQKATTPDDLDKAMKKVGPAQGAVNKAIQSMAYADAKAQLAI